MKRNFPLPAFGLTTPQETDKDAKHINSTATDSDKSVFNSTTQKKVTSETLKKNQDNSSDTVDVLNVKNNFVLSDKQKDDWSIDEIEIDKINGYNLKVPSFIRLFVIQRIISRYIKDASNSSGMRKPEIEVSKVIQDLVTVFQVDDSGTKEIIANEILTRLINNGIKKYMNNWYNEKTHANIIEDIFNQIILIKFGDEYNRLISFVSNNDYKNQLFNSSDLMCKIFQYLQYGYSFDGDLFNCSLVNSYWLYHVWNVNSVFDVNLNKLIQETAKLKSTGSKKDNFITRMWQRLIHVKSIFIFLYQPISTNKLLLDKLLLLKTIDFVRISLDENDDDKTAILQRVLSGSKERIKTCDISVSKKHDDWDEDSKKEKENQLSPLQLPNAQIIEIGDLFFYRVWSDKCHKLNLQYVHDISKDWCQFVTKYCDCSGIKNLKLVDLSFCFDQSTLDAQDKQTFNYKLLKQLASKFTGLKRLKITLWDEFDKNVVLFWQLLKPIIVKNNTQIVLEIYQLTDSDYNSLNKMIEEEKLKISKLIIDEMHEDVDNNHTNTIKFIENRDNDGLKDLQINANKFTFSILNEKKNVLAQLSFHSINALNIVTHHDKGGCLSHVNDFLTLNIDTIIEKKLFVIVDAVLQCGGNESKFLGLFKELCENISKLVIEQNAVDFDISFEETSKEIFNSCATVYSSHFQSKQFVSEYKEPNCDEQKCLVTPRDEPFTYHGVVRGNEMTFEVTNVSYV